MAVSALVHAEHRRRRVCDGIVAAGGSDSSRSSIPLSRAFQEPAEVQATLTRQVSTCPATRQSDLGPLPQPLGLAASETQPPPAGDERHLPRLQRYQFGVGQAAGAGASAVLPGRHRVRPAREAQDPRSGLGCESAPGPLPGRMRGNLNMLNAITALIAPGRAKVGADQQEAVACPRLLDPSVGTASRPGKRPGSS